MSSSQPFVKPNCLLQIAIVLARDEIVIASVPPKVLCLQDMLSILHSSQYCTSLSCLKIRHQEVAFVILLFFVQTYLSLNNLLLQISA